MHMAETYAKLRKLTDEELICKYDELAKRTQVGLNFLLDELARREAKKQHQRILKLTKQMRNLTIVIAILTAVNVAVVLIALFKSP